MDMIGVASSAAQPVLKKCCSTSKIPSPNATKIAFVGRNAANSTKSSKTRAILVRASQSEKEESNPTKNEPDNPELLSQEDLNYLVKLGAGSVVGAAAIKYGSALFPEITRPNVTEALAIISFPVVAAVLLLIWQSGSERT